MKEIKNFQEYKSVMNQEKPVLLDFYTDWCGPCQALLPIVEKLSEKYQDEFKIYKVNADNFRELARQFNVRSIPALFVLKQGKIAENLVGFHSEQKLDEIIQSHLAAVTI